MIDKIPVFVLFIIYTVAAPLFLIASPVQNDNRYQIDFYDYRHGFPEENVHAVAQTQDGYLWLGATGGLYRFDGVTFELMNTGRKGKGKYSHVMALAVDEQNRLWIGTYNGMLIYENRHFRFCSGQNGFPEGFIRNLHCDSFGDVWFCVEAKGLFRFKDGKVENVGAKRRLPVKEAYYFLRDSKGNLWVSGYQEGLFVDRGGGFETFPIHVIEKKYAVYWISSDSTGTLWVGTNRGLVEIDKNERVVALHSMDTGLSDSLILGPTIEDHRGDIWVATSMGLSRLRRRPAGGYDITNYSKDTSCPFLLRDRENSIWIASLGQGLGRLRKGVFRTYTGEHGVNMYFNTLLVTRSGELLAGSAIGQLHRFQNHRFERFFSFDNTAVNGIVAMAEDHDGVLWLGTIYAGLIRLENGMSRKYDTRDGLAHNYIRSLTVDHKNRLWIGSRQGGLTVLENDTFRIFGSDRGFAVKNVFNIHEDRRKNIWIGSTSGLYCLPNGNLDSPSPATYLKGMFIQGIHENLETGVFWICTQDHGLIRFETENSFKYVSFTKEHGMPTDTLYTILPDDKGYFWLTCPIGVLRVSIDQLNQVAAGEVDRLQCTLFGREDGLNSTSFRNLAKSGAVKTPDGRFWFASQRGISAVHPGKMTINKIPPPVNLKEILFNFEPVPVTASGRTFKGIKSFVFRFSVPTMVAPGKVKIKFRLEGYHDQWRERNAFQPREAQYKNLPYGKYRFHVIAANSSGVWNKTGAVFDFTLEPYFYQTMMFKGSIAFIVSLVLIAGIFSLRRYLFMKKLKQKYKHSTLDPEKAEKVLKKAGYLMEIEKIYTDETLSLDSFAQRISIQSRYLSQIINERLGKNFRDYINSFRVEAAKELLRNPYKEKLSVIEIALEVGFNSKEVFNRAFKKFTDMTPTEFKKKNRPDLT